jgi:glycosyltransferase involved in cell wall biosynthesis
LNTLKPLIDVIIAVHNGAEFLAQSLQSIRNQSFTNHHIWVVDDASTDESVDIARAFEGVTVLQPGKVRQPGAMNFGIEHSTAPFIAFLDADDLWTPEKLDLQMQYLTNHPEVDGVFGAIRQFTSTNTHATPESMQWLGPPQHGVSLTTLLIRRPSMNTAGLLNTDSQVNHLVDWYSRALSRNLVFRWIPETVMHRRVHAQNMTRVDRPNVVKGYAGALKLKLDQQRSNSTGT